MSLIKIFNADCHGTFISRVNGHLKLNPREVDSHLKILSGKTAVIDSTVKGNRGGDVNGHVKVRKLIYVPRKIQIEY